MKCYMKYVTFSFTLPENYLYLHIRIVADGTAIFLQFFL